VILLEGKNTRKSFFVKLQVIFAAAKQTAGILLVIFQLVDHLLARENMFCNYAKHSDFCKNENIKNLFVNNVKRDLFRNGKILAKILR